MMFLLGLLFVAIIYAAVRALEAWSDRRSTQQFEAERRRRQAAEAARPDSDLTWWCDVLRSSMFCSLCKKWLEKGQPLFQPNWALTRHAGDRLLLGDYPVSITQVHLCHDCFKWIALSDPAQPPETHELKVRKDWIDILEKLTREKAAATDEPAHVRLRESPERATPATALHDKDGPPPPEELPDEFYERWFDEIEDYSADSDET